MWNFGALLLPALLCTPLRDQEEAPRPVVLRAGTILTGVGAPLKNGALLMKDGRIAAVAWDVAVPPDAWILDAGPDAVVTPGFLDANSHLEFGNERSASGLQDDLVRILGPATEVGLDQARSGITTVMLQSWSPLANGSRVTAVKTAGATREARVVDSLAGLHFLWGDDQDPPARAERLANDLRQGKAYFDEWQKYHEALQKWEEDRAAGKVTQKKPAEDEGPAVTTEQKVDPISGTWEFEREGRRGPSTVTMVLKLEGTKVTGTYDGGFGGRGGGGGGPPAARPVTGTFQGNTLRLELGGGGGGRGGFTQVIVATVGQDTFTGTIQFGEQEPSPITGKRISKDAAPVTTIRRRRVGDDGRPVPPETRPQLEPYRRLFAGEVPLILQASHAVDLTHALPVLKDAKVPVVLLGAEQADRLSPQLKEGIRGIVLPAELRTTRDDRPWIPCLDMAGWDLPLAFQSHSDTSARGLRESVAWAVLQGLDPTRALQALTIDPARMFQVEDRVGSLERGKDADVLVFSGNPFELSSRLLHVFVDGRRIEDRP